MGALHCKELLEIYKERSREYLTNTRRALLTSLPREISETAVAERVADYISLRYLYLKLAQYEGILSVYFLISYFEGEELRGPALGFISLICSLNITTQQQQISRNQALLLLCRVSNTAFETVFSHWLLWSDIGTAQANNLCETAGNGSYLVHLFQAFQTLVELRTINISANEPSHANSFQHAMIQILNTAQQLLRETYQNYLWMDLDSPLLAEIKSRLAPIFNERRFLLHKEADGHAFVDTMQKEYFALIREPNSAMTMQNDIQEKVRVWTNQYGAICEPELGIFHIALNAVPTSVQKIMPTDLVSLNRFRSEWLHSKERCRGALKTEEEALQQRFQAAMKQDVTEIGSYVTKDREQINAEFDKKKQEIAQIKTGFSFRMQGSMNVYGTKAPDVNQLMVFRR